MRLHSSDMLRTLRVLSAVKSIAMYGVVISSLFVSVAWLGGALVRNAETPVSGLMQLGDASLEVAKASRPVTRSSVLEGDAWLQNLKSEFQAKDRTRGSRPLPASNGLLGQGELGMISPKPEGSLNESRSRRSVKHDAHRTVCVRLCDGYFWPISFATSEDNFDRDQSVCENSCASPAKLYVYENPGQEPEQMVSLKGQSYTKLSTAFLFRTKLDQSCKCNPHPWEQEAMDRHRKYADDAEKKKLMRKADIDVGPSEGQKSVTLTKSEIGSRQQVVAIESISISKWTPVANFAVLNAAASDGGLRAPNAIIDGPVAKAKTSGGASTSRRSLRPDWPIMQRGTRQAAERGALQPDMNVGARPTLDWRVAIFSPR